MDKVLEWIEKFATGKKRRVFWLIVVFLIFIIIILYPYIDANFLCYDRIEKRLNNLEKLVYISGETIYENEDLKTEYDSILTETKNAQAKQISLTFNKKETKADYWVKFFGASALCFFIAIVCLFSKNDKAGIKNNFLPFFLCACAGILLGFVLAKIPVIVNSWVNALIYIAVEILLVFLFATNKKQKPLLKRSF